MVYDPISLLSENDWAIINKIAAAPLCGTQKVQWCETYTVTVKSKIYSTVHPLYQYNTFFL